MLAIVDSGVEDLSVENALVLEDLSLSFPVMKVGEDNEIIDPMPFRHIYDILTKEENSNVHLPILERDIPFLRDDLSLAIAVVVSAFVFSSYSSVDEIHDYIDGKVDRDTVQLIVSKMIECNIYDKVNDMVYIRPITDQIYGMIYFYIEIATIYYELTKVNLFEQDSLMVLVIDDGVDTEKETDGFTIDYPHSHASG